MLGEHISWKDDAKTVDSQNAENYFIFKTYFKTITTLCYKAVSRSFIRDYFFFYLFICLKLNYAIIG